MSVSGSVSHDSAYKYILRNRGSIDQPTEQISPTTKRHNTNFDHWLKLNCTVTTDSDETAESRLDIYRSVPEEKPAAYSSDTFEADVTQMLSWLDEAREDPLLNEMQEASERAAKQEKAKKHEQLAALKARQKVEEWKAARGEQSQQKLVQNKIKMLRNEPGFRQAFKLQIKEHTLHRIGFHKENFQDFVCRNKVNLDKHLPEMRKRRHVKLNKLSEQRRSNAPDKKETNERERVVALARQIATQDDNFVSQWTLDMSERKQAAQQWLSAVVVLEWWSIVNSVAKAQGA